MYIELAVGVSCLTILYIICFSGTFVQIRERWSLWIITWQEEDTFSKEENGAYVFSRKDWTQTGFQLPLRLWVVFEMWSLSM